MQLIVATALSAFLMWASFPPLDFGFLIFVAPAPFLWAIRSARSPREAGWLGFLFGALFWGAMLSWIFVLGAVAWFPLTAVMGAYAAAYALVMYLARTWEPWRWWLMATGSWAAWEFLRARWPFGGFPWGSTGYAVGTLDWPRGAAQWIGPTGWGVLVVAFAASLVLAAEEEGDRRWTELTGGIILALTIMGAIWGPSAGGKPVQVAIVQGNSPCPRVHCPNEKQQIYNSHLRLTRRIVAAEGTGDVDLVVWGEDSFGGAYNPTFNTEVASQMAGEAVRLDAFLIAGGTRPAGPGYFDNFNVVFSPEGSIVGEYLKTHPVPFGEYVPFRELLRFIPQLDDVPNDMTRGEGPVVFPLDVDGEEVVMGSVISFEGAFVRTVRSEVNAGARIVVVATNEGSYGRGSASDQLIGMVRMIAPSLGVDIAHAAVTGKSAIIHADGTIVETTELFTEEILFGVLRDQRSPRTFYSITGDWLQVAMMLVAVGLLLGSRTPQRGFKIRPERRRD
ncbi:MAG: apolipoprotein N-acyltransferase [Actinobacteria bacterium]|nr:apolipoprotein N-acyltransferase [Actinomycetota bacterium]